MFDLAAELERKQEIVEEWTAFEHEYGYAETLKRWAHELLEWWAVCNGDPESRQSWRLAHPIVAPMERASV